MITTIRTSFLDTAQSTAHLLAHPELASRWDEPSALAEMTVAMLAGHLVRAVTTVERYLDTARPPRADDESLDAAGYFLSVDDLTGPDGPDLDLGIHRSIRERGSEEASVGAAGLLQRWQRATSGLAGRLASVPDDARITVLGGRTIPVDDYLVTRIIEMVVHGDDLAVSLGITPPPTPQSALDVCIETLLTTARRQHGDLAVIRAMTRIERDIVAALRVF